MITWQPAIHVVLNRLMLGLLCSLSVSVGHAGLFDDEEARRAILDLRQQNTDVRQQLDALKRETNENVQRLSEENAQLRRGLLDLQNQLEALRAELAQLRGRGEQVARDVAEMQRQQKDVAQGVDERLRKLEPVRVTVDGKEFMVEPAEKRDYENGLAVFRKGNFLNAQVVFVDFLNRYSQTGYRPSALFWLGNAQYATKDYKEALANFRALVAVAADHMRVPEAVLAIANCQLELKDTKGARKTLEDLVASYPGTEAATAAKDRLARFK